MKVVIGRKTLQCCVDGRTFPSDDDDVVLVVVINFFLTRGGLSRNRVETLREASCLLRFGTIVDKDRRIWQLFPCEGNRVREWNGMDCNGDVRRDPGVSTRKTILRALPRNA